MRIPSSIDKNTLKAYELHQSIISEDPPTLASYNFEGWDEQLPKSLQESCVEAIAKNWTEHPVLDEIVLSIDRYLLLDLLKTDLPLSLTIPRIHDDIYWRKCYVERWPKYLPHNVQPVEIFEIVRNTDVRKLSSVYSGRTGSSRNSIRGNGSEKCSSKSSQASRRSSKISSTNKENKIASGKRTWKEYYIEMHVKEYLENLKPEKYEPEKIKELSDMCSPYIKVLIIDQMQCSENSPNRIPLNSILTGFQSLKELTFCFKQTYVGEQFSWNVLNTSFQDIKLLAKGLEKLRLRVLRIRNSDIDCEKLIAILKALLKHEIHTLDFSHCKVADRGVLAISKFSLEVPAKEIIMANNRIGFKGIHSLAYALCQNTCQITNLDLRLNQFADDADAGNLLLGAVTTGAKNLKSLFLSGCGFSGNNSIGKMLQANKSLEVLDISNNNIGENVGQIIMEAMQDNFTLKRLDLRMCRISSETEFAIHELVHQNRKSRKVPTKRHVQEDAKLEIETEDLILELEKIFQ